MESRKVEVLTNAGDQVEILGAIDDNTVYIERSELDMASLTEDFPVRIARAFRVEVIKIVASVDGIENERSKFELRPFESK